MQGLVIALLAALFGGCGRPEVVPNTPLEVKDVPAVVAKAAIKKFPDTKLKTACKTPEGNYEIYTQSKRGKTHLVVVSETGEIVDSE